MPKLPMCQKYFRMLGAVQFFSYYFSTLKTMQKAPVFAAPPPRTESGFPAVLGALPIRYQNDHNSGEVSMQEVIARLEQADKAEIEQELFRQATAEPNLGVRTLVPRLNGAVFAAFHAMVEGDIQGSLEGGPVRNDSQAVREFSQTFMAALQGWLQARSRYTTDGYRARMERQSLSVLATEREMLIPWRLTSSCLSLRNDPERVP